MENTSLFNQTKRRAFTGLELLKLFNKYSGCNWSIEHTPKAMKIYTHSGIYTITADSTVVDFKEG